jgi:hypothetical protein
MQAEESKQKGRKEFRRMKAGMPVRKSEFLTLSEASDLMGIAANTLRKKVYDGKIPEASVTSSGIVLIAESDLEMVRSRLNDLRDQAKMGRRIGGGNEEYREKMRKISEARQAARDSMGSVGSTRKIINDDLLTLTEAAQFMGVKKEDLMRPIMEGGFSCMPVVAVLIPAHYLVELKQLARIESEQPGDDRMPEEQEGPPPEEQIHPEERKQEEVLNAPGP